MLAGAGAQAAEPGVRSFDVPPSRLTDALVGFALQADVTVGGSGLAACGTRSPGVRGRLAAATALARLLEGTGCDFRVIDAGSFQVLRVPARTVGPAPTRAPPERAEPTLPQVLTEIILTAPKLSGPAGRVPYAVSVVSGSDLEAARTRDAGQLALQTAGLTVTNLGAGWDKMFLRGLSDGPFTGRAQATVGTYLDDFRINFDAPDPDLLLTDVQDVEVLRGPQGTLYGSGSIGGIYRIVTRKPDLDRFGASVGSAGAITKSGAPSGSVEGMLNLVLVPGRLAIRGVAYDEVAGGYIDNPRLGLSDLNRTQRSGGRLAAKLRLDDRWSATLSGIYQGITARDAQYVVGSGGGLFHATAVTEPQDNDFASLGLTLEGSGAWGRFTSATALVNHSQSVRYDASASLAAFGGGGSAAAFDSTQHKETLVEEADLASPTGRRLQWMAGLFLATGDEQGTSLVTARPMGTQLYREARKDVLRESAVYGELTYELTARLKLSGGVRAFRFRRMTRSAVTLPSGPASSQGEAPSDGLAPKLVAEFEVSPAVTVYVQAAEGYRPAGFSSGGLPADAGPGAGGFKRFGADELWNYEAGLKASVWEGRLQLQTAVYRVHWRNLQTDQILPSGLPYTVNIGDARNTGVEVEAALRVDSHLTLHSALSVNDPQLYRLNPALPPLTEEEPLPSIAKVTASVAVDYSRPLAPALKAVFGANVQHVGASGLTFQARTKEQMGDYTTMRLSGGLAGDRWRAGLYLDNPMNATGNTFAFGNPFSFRSASQRTPQRPLTLGLSLSAHY